MTQETPMMRQYKEIKSSQKDAILFFRLGDFYEMFYDDAILASKELEITLTARGQDENRMPMCGIPFHAAASYIAKLVDKGYKVAICEQVEDPKDAKGVVRREVIKVITPGTVLDSAMLDEKANNYLASVNIDKDTIGFAYIDISTGEFKVTDITGIDAIEALNEEIDRVSPKELLIPDMIPDKFKQVEARIRQLSCPNSRYKDIYDIETSEQRLNEHFKVRSLDSLGIPRQSFGAVAAILDYLKGTQRTSMRQLNRISYYRAGSSMYLDGSTRRNLELVQTIRDRSVKGSLLWIMDSAVTSMGSRKLRSWILQPLLSEKEINGRYDAVGELTCDNIMRQKLITCLESVFDIERLTAKIASGNCNGRDLVALAGSLKVIPMIKQLLKGSRSAYLSAGAGMDEMNEIISLISSSIADDPPLTIKEGGMIRQGYNGELDEIRKIAHGGKDWIAKLEDDERRRTGIKSLKVGYTKVFGYYIEVSNSNIENVPESYIRKQTLVNCERFITPELKEQESIVLNAETRMNELEYEVFCGVREKAAGHAKMLQDTADIISTLDALCSFAAFSIENKCCRPTFTGDGMKIIKGRHPVVERTIGTHIFVPNDLIMDKKSRFLLITGPNMAGKSTYMRQAAIISIIAQAGCFVPAESAELSMTDRIFTRIGAMDDIYSGQSTFMVEMTEVANIINNATEKSLIVLDEIGRGTSTFDGMAIAAAVSEYIHLKIKARTLFATHYHELTQLADKLPGMKNLNILVKEERDHVTFLHKIVDGPANRSYGIQVAKLAGLPDDIIKRAKEVYGTLEMVENDLAKSSNVPIKNEKRSGKPELRGYSDRRERDQIGLF